MVNTKKIATSVVALVLSLVSVFCLCVPASAATKSNGTKTVTMIVETKANWLYPGSESITLSQTKGTCSLRTYNIFKGKWQTKTSKVYGEWDIVAEATDGSHRVTATLSGSSVKIKLKPNKTYKITVTWDSMDETFTTLDKGAYTKYPTWKVKSTHKVSKYY